MHTVTSFRSGKTSFGRGNMGQELRRRRISRGSLKGAGIAHGQSSAMVSTATSPAAW